MAKNQILGQIFMRSFAIIWVLFLIMGADNIDTPIRLALASALPATIGGGITGIIYMIVKNDKKREILDTLFFERS